jgi:hypothetical protein
MFGTYLSSNLGLFLCKNLKKIIYFHFKWGFASK